MPKSVDGDIRISVEIDDSGVVKGEKNISKIMSSMSRGMGKLGKEISSVYSQGAAEIEKYTIKLAKAEESVKKQEIAVQKLRDKLDALKNGDVTPQSLKNLDSKIEKAEKEFDELIAKMDAAKEKVESFDIGAEWNPDLDKAQEEYAQLAEQVAKAGGKLDAMKAKAEAIRLDPQSSAEGKNISRDLESANATLERMKTEAGFAAEGLERAKEAAKDANKEIKKTPNSLKKANSAAKRFKQLIASAFVFNVFSRGLNELQESLSGALKTNTQFSNSVAKIKGNLITAFMPIYEAVLPAVNSLASGLSSVSAQTAAFIATLSGTTVEKAADAAENLYEQAKATDAVTDATKEANKSLASFDEINKITADNTNTEIAPDFSGITDVDTSGAVAAANKLSPVLDAFGKFANNLATAFKDDFAPKLKDFGAALLDFLPDLGELDAEDLADILDAVAVGIGGFVGIKITTSVITGISNLGTTLGSFLTTIGAHPVLTIASAITTLLLALKGYANYKYQGSELSKIIDFYNNVTESSNEAVASSQAFVDMAHEKIDGLDTKFKSIDTIADKYYTLSQKATLTESDKLLLEEYYKFLTNNGVELTGKIDEVTKAYQGTRTELQGMIEDLKELYYVEAGKELLQGAIQDELNLIAKIEDQKEAVATLKNAYKDAQAVFDSSYNGLHVAPGLEENTGFAKTLENWITGLDKKIDLTGGFTAEAVGLKEAEEAYNSAMASLADLEEQLTTIKSEQQSYQDMVLKYSQEYSESVAEETEKNNELADSIDGTKNSTAELNAELNQTTQGAGALNSTLGEVAKKVFDGVKQSVNTLKDEISRTDTSTTELGTDLDTVDSMVVNPDFTPMKQDLDEVYQKVSALIAKLKETNALKTTTAAITGTVGVLGSILKVPLCAQGAVIPANKPFLAMLGDQRSGTNVEAPLSTIQEAVAAVMQGQREELVSLLASSIGVQNDILEAILGIQIGDDVIGKAALRYNNKRKIMYGG